MTTTDFGGLLAAYRNGNVDVRLYQDGTKTRTWPDGESPKPAFPESVDLKITDYCDAGCRWCHESSTQKGRQASFHFLAETIRLLPPHTELAIGGGDPMSHTELDEILLLVRSCAMYANLTVNEFHVCSPLVRNRLNEYHAMGLVRGIGVSLLSLDGVLEARKLHSRHVVIHAIVGVHDNELIRAVYKEFDRLLLLGYKDWGRGHAFSDRIGDRVRKDHTDGLAEILPELLATPGKVLAFDNLAIKQLKLRTYVDKATWDRCYMGDDGTHTAYIDLVKREFARTSYSPERFPLSEAKHAGDLLTHGRQTATP